MSNTEYTLNDFLAFKYQVYKHRASEKKRAFKLTFAKFKKLVLSPCHFCGGLPEDGYAFVHGNRRFKINTIDRIDNSGGYMADNVLTSCTFCNYCRGDLRPEQFLEWANRVANKTKLDASLTENSIIINETLRLKLLRQKHGMGFRE